MVHTVQCGRQRVVVSRRRPMARHCQSTVTAGTRVAQDNPFRQEVAQSDAVYSKDNAVVKSANINADKEASGNGSVKSTGTFAVHLVLRVQRVFQVLLLRPSHTCL